MPDSQQPAFAALSASYSLTSGFQCKHEHRGYTRRCKRGRAHRSKGIGEGTRVSLFPGKIQWQHNITWIFVHQVGGYCGGWLVRGCGNLVLVPAAAPALLCWHQSIGASQPCTQSTALELYPLYSLSQPYYQPDLICFCIAPLKVGHSFQKPHYLHRKIWWNFKVVYSNQCSSVQATPISHILCWLEMPHFFGFFISLQQPPRALLEF